MRRKRISNWRLTIEYDGCGYYGWQRQPGHRTIQGELERALSTVLREPVRVTGSGRTDAGVHALGQVANFHPRSVIDPKRLRWQVNAVLSDDIVVTALDPVPDGFNARYSATRRTYSYYILNRPYPSPFWRPHSWWVAKDLDLAAAREAAALLVGIHDFAGFTVDKEGPTVRRVDEISLVRESCVELTARNVPGANGLIRIRITGNAFLRHMVRLVVGTLAEVAVGKRPPGAVREILDAQDVRLAGPRAPAKGLWLERVDYD